MARSPAAKLEQRVWRLHRDGHGDRRIAKLLGRNLDDIRDILAQERRP